jgi:hypothetical protein
MIAMAEMTAQQQLIALLRETCHSQRSLLVTRHHQLWSLWLQSPDQYEALAILSDSMLTLVGEHTHRLHAWKGQVNPAR